MVATHIVHINFFFVCRSIIPITLSEVKQFEIPRPDILMFAKDNTHMTYYYPNQIAWDSVLS
jgi:hypothetical protein